MNILCICGSSREGSSSLALLNYLSEIDSQKVFQYYPIKNIPVFHTDLDRNPLPQEVIGFRSAVAQVDAMIISSPEYLHNIPALLKNALEWLSSSGELHEKSVLPIIYTPMEPRGAKAMQSLLWTLGALKAKIPGSLHLFHSDIAFNEQEEVNDNGGKALILEALKII